MTRHYRRMLTSLAGVVLLIAAVMILRVELRAVTWHDLTTDMAAIPRTHLALALGLTALNFVVLIGYDLVAFAYIGKRISRGVVAVTSCLAFGVSNSVGLAMLSGLTVRYRFYRRSGVTAGELSRLAFSYSVTLWLGLLALGGLSLAMVPVDGVRVSTTAQRAIGGLLFALPCLYLVAAAFYRRPLTIRGVVLALPSLPIAASQFVLSVIDWLLIAGVLFVLLPSGALPFLVFLQCFLVAILIGMVSHSPGGVGVFDGVLVLLLKPYLASTALLPALVVFRAVYYLLPLALALAGLLTDEALQRRAHLQRWLRHATALATRLTPQLLSGLTFVAGLVLLFSSATPAAPDRLAWLDTVLPLGVIETSHFLGSIAGTALLLLSQGLWRRLDGAFYLTTLVIAIGMATSLLKGFDYEEATLLLAVLLALWQARSAFNRRAAFFDARFPASWIAALVGAVGASVWLGLFAFQHVGYSNELWWQFELHGEASRFLRASVGAAVVLALFGFARLIGYAPHQAPVPTAQDLADADRIVASQRLTFPFLVYLRDKALLFNEARTAFLMYGVQGRTWIALGDPVGPPDQYAEVIRAFLERCRDFGGVPVFYEVGKTHLHVYADVGLAFVKLGEEAKVDLSSFTTEGGRGAKFRQAVRKLEREGRTFRVVSPTEVPAIAARLREVSDRWLNAKACAEKGFSLGFFDEAYVSRFPVAVVEHLGEIEAFANIWPGFSGEEVSVDLMRYQHSAPNGVMEALFVHIMTWAQGQGFRQFAIGMAPLAGVEQSPLSPLWNRVGSFMYEHGESIYNFQGLRAYKEKFNPVWSPRYLAYPGGFRLPRIMADVSALVAGGYRHIFRK